MSGKGRKAESVSDIAASPTVADIEAIVHKAVEAAVKVVRTEFAKLFEDVLQRIRDLEERLGAAETINQHLSELHLEDRLAALETSHAKPSPAAAVSGSELEIIRQESRDAIVLANDNEQYSRRNNLRIKGLTLPPHGNGRQAVADFCHSKLKITDIKADDIEAVHMVSGRTGSPTNGSAASTTSATVPQSEPTALVRFRQREIRDSVVRCRRNLKGTGMAVIEDLTSLNIKTLNRARNSELVANTWTWNGRIYALLKSGRNVKPFQPIQNCEQVQVMSHA